MLNATRRQAVPVAAGPRQHNAAAIAGSALISGAVASAATAVALAVLARSEGKRGVQPLNATSHWLHGEGAGGVTRADLSHTFVGSLTHLASSIFWAVPFEAWLSRQERPAAPMVVGSAAAVSAIAAVVDYGLVPKRLTPGWESVLSRRSLVKVYGVLALGLAAGAILSRRRAR